MLCAPMVFSQISSLPKNCEFISSASEGMATTRASGNA